MSAFVVNKSHINALLHAGMAVRYRPLTWRHNGESHTLTDESATVVGQMLLDECVRSVCYRYEGDSMANLPGRTNAEWLIPFEYRFTHRRPTPIEALSLISCYEYQSCEHDEWETSEAKAFCDALRHCTIPRLPGYDEAPGSWDDPDYYKANRPVRLV